MSTAHWHPATSSTSSASASPGHIAPLLNGSEYGTVSPFIDAWLGLGLPDVTTHVLVAPRLGAVWRTTSSAIHPVTATARAGAGRLGVIEDVARRDLALLVLEHLDQTVAGGEVHPLRTALAHRADVGVGSPCRELGGVGAEVIDGTESGCLADSHRDGE